MLLDLMLYCNTANPFTRTAVGFFAGDDKPSQSVSAEESLLHRLHYVLLFIRAEKAGICPFNHEGITHPLHLTLLFSSR